MAPLTTVPTVFPSKDAKGPTVALWVVTCGVPPGVEPDGVAAVAGVDVPRFLKNIGNTKIAKIIINISQIMINCFKV